MPSVEYFSLYSPFEQVVLQAGSQKKFHACIQITFWHRKNTAEFGDKNTNVQEN